MAQAQSEKLPAKRETPSAKAQASHRAKGQEIKAELDALLEEIDEVLEEEAETFIKSYVQKGGQ